MHEFIFRLFFDETKFPHHFCYLMPVRSQRCKIHAKGQISHHGEIADKQLISNGHWTEWSAYLGMNSQLACRFDNRTKHGAQVDVLLSQVCLSHQRLHGIQRDKYHFIHGEIADKQLISNGNWTEWSVIWDGIIRAISKLNEHEAQVDDLKSHWVWSQTKIARHEIQLPLYYTHFNEITVFCQY